MDSGIRRQLSADSRRILRRFSSDRSEANLRIQEQLADGISLSAFWPALGTLKALNLVVSVKNGWALTAAGYDALDELSQDRADLPWERENRP